MQQMLLQVLDVLPTDAAGVARLASQLTDLALRRAETEHASEAAALQEIIHEKNAHVAELEHRCESLYSEHGALAQDLLECHEQCERLAGQKAALAAAVKQLADKVQCLHPSLKWDNLSCPRPRDLWVWHQQQRYIQATYCQFQQTDCRS
jgi:chromosome segregation ATPase